MRWRAEIGAASTRGLCEGIINAVDEMGTTWRMMVYYIDLGDMGQGARDGAGLPCSSVHVHCIALNCIVLALH